MNKTTESDSFYDGLEKMGISDLLININKEDKTVAHSVEKQILKIKKLIETIVSKMKNGGRYISKSCKNIVCYACPPPPYIFQL